MPHDTPVYCPLQALRAKQGKQRVLLHGECPRELYGAIEEELKGVTVAGKQVTVEEIGGGNIQRIVHAWVKK